MEGKLISQNTERAFLLTKVAAIRGSVNGRHNAGSLEYEEFGRHELGIRHWKIAAEGGAQCSLDALKTIYNADGKLPGKEFISKDELDDLYRACHEVQSEINTEERKKHCDLKDDQYKC